jgi:hypothetical protein
VSVFEGIFANILSDNASTSFFLFVLFQLSRARRHGSLLGDLLQWGALVGIAAFGSNYAYKVLFDKNSNYNSLARLRPKKT